MKLTDVLASLELGVLLARHNTESVGAEVITLRQGISQRIFSFG
jgi:hypothetical protein